MNRLFVLLLFIGTIGCGQKTGGACEYNTMEEEVGISEIVEANGEITFISFAAGDASSVRSYRISAAELEPFMADFDFHTLKEERKSLLLQGEAISKGSCVPFVFTHLQHLD